MAQQASTMPASAASAAYTCDGLEREFRQGEIVGSVSQHNYVHGDAPSIRSITHEFSIIVSQDCDLLKHYNDQSRGEEGALNSVLLFEVRDLSELARTESHLKGNDGKRIKQNNNERYHFLGVIPADKDLLAKGSAELVIDFRRFFAIPIEELTRQCTPDGGATRRTRLRDVYREHLQARMAFYLQRVGLPTPYET